MKVETLKMSTSLTRDTHIRGWSQKHPQSQPETLQRSLKKRIAFCIVFWSVVLPIWAPFWVPRGLPLGAKIGQKGAMLKGSRGSWRKLRAQGAQGRHQTPKILQKASHLDPKDLQNDAKKHPAKAP